MSIRFKSSSSIKNIQNSQEMLSINKKIEIQQQKSYTYEQKIAILEEKCKNLKLQTCQKEEKLKSIQLEIKKCQEYKNPIIQQLRQHFKALREELGEAFDAEEDEDEVDVDSMSYEELLELGERIGKVSKGVSQQKLNQLERINYNSHEQQTNQCTICRDDFDEGQECMKLQCKHYFHSGCLKEWLKMEKTCPNCKSQIA